MSLEKRSPKTRAEWVYDWIKERILSDEYRPSERLVADRLAVELGTSVVPIREALLRLEAEGLVELQPHVGARVAPVSEAEALELFELRRLLEPLAAKSAVYSATPAVIEDLERLYAAMDDAIQKEDTSDYARKNFQFHDCLYKESAWQTLYNFTNSVMSRMGQSRWTVRLTPQHAAQSQLEHRAMLEALKSGDAEAMEAICRKQMDRVFPILITRLREREQGRHK
jgi:DNA-binding GntR family transcriptional regulator